MNKERTITQEAFDSLLAWLDPERERAGEKYEAIRRRLITIFTCRGCSAAEDLADETINRVAAKAQELMNNYVGDPALYFYGVANKVRMEYFHRKPAALVPLPAPETDEREYDCLEQCMGELSPENRQLVLNYYREDKQARIESRKALAERMGIALNALRIRAHRIRLALQQCVEECMERKRQNEI